MEGASSVEDVLGMEEGSYVQEISRDATISNLHPEAIYILGLWANALHGSTRLIFFLQYIHSYIYNK